MMRVLIAEDDENILNGLSDILANEGYETILARDGEQALSLFSSESPDFVCLDIMMPNKSGYDACRQIRKQNSRVPIIFISAKSEEIDKVVGLELGADDFIVKPFGVKEVVARIRAITRRCFSQKREDELPMAFIIGDLQVFPSELRARRNDETIELSLREVALLELFSKNPGVVLQRNQIFDYCWGESFYPASRTLDQHIAKLRKRIEVDPKHPVIIQTVHGVGYRYDG